MALWDSVAAWVATLNISQVFASLFYSLIYPFAWALNILQTLVNTIYAPFAIVLNIMIICYNTVATLISGVFSVVFPSAWTSLLVVALIVKIALSMYRYLRDVEILGCKI